MHAEVREPLVNALRLQAGIRRLDGSRSCAATRIALIDGAIERNHLSLSGASIEQTAPADPGEGSAHATFIASMLVGRGPGVLGLCPGCTLVSFPVADARFTQGMLPAPDAARRLAQAVMQALASGAHVIQLSMQFAFELDASFRALHDALLAAARRGVRTVIAAGNKGPAGAGTVLRLAGVVPVAMARPDGSPASAAALGPALGARGLLAPGTGIPGAAIPSGSTTRSGSSFAAAFVTASFALLRCQFPQLSSDAIWHALLSPRLRSRSIAPPALDADSCLTMLASHYRRTYMNLPYDPAASGEAPAEPSPTGDAHTCTCNPGGGNIVEQYIYSIGKIEVRFPTIGIEREFQQRERSLSTGNDNNGPRVRGERLAAVLRASPHLARTVCFIQTIGGTPAYALVPNNTETLHAMLDSVARGDQDDAWALVIGRAGPMAAPATCGGLMVQMVACDVLYGFTLAEFADGLVNRVEHILQEKKIDREQFLLNARELFGRIVLSMENMGAQDTHRALNYLLVQHAGPFIALAERSERAILDNVETRLSVTAGARRVVSVILTFIERSSGVPERLFTRIDVTEEWPFAADAPNAAAVPLGLHPFVDSGWQGNSLSTAL